MKRKVYLKGDELLPAEYGSESDAPASWRCRQDSPYQTGAPIIQLDFVKYRGQQEPEDKNGNDID